MPLSLKSGSHPFKDLLAHLTFTGQLLKEKNESFIKFVGLFIHEQ